MRGAAGGEVAGEEADEKQAATEAMRVIVSVAWIAKEHIGDEARAGEGDGDADRDSDSDEEKYLAHDEPADIGAFRAEGHADADFVGAAGDHVGHQTVDADAGEEDGEQAEEGGELRDEALPGDGAGDLLVERGDAGDGEVGVDGVDGALDGGGDGGGIAGVADNKITEELVALRVENVVERLGGFVEVLEFDVPGDADDLHLPPRAVGVADGVVAADGIGSWGNRFWRSAR